VDLFARGRLKLRKLVPIRRRADLEQWHIHQMRHTFACRFQERGGSLPALQQILGHASIITTQRYARLSDESVRAEVHRIAQREAVR
jgi:site-specific recombinase XerD